ncbi:energy-dependent translational throttle protein EttA [Streptomyces sp. LaPpAH-108]|uniref:energy-dependent translational throttle protein EttA n=1 Tax=Streptomyces sp. LaPpAH-108 TaxID=1155714 RepID=UPI00036FF6C7|nr:energy-dependent translational throttle protein EttA [Streptomyces sp. LaPpAH-108]
MYAYTMRRARMAHGDKVVLDDVTLAFRSGARVGVVGPNGMGKSTVLRIMAGLERPVGGDAFAAPGSSVGLLEQEPRLDDTVTVREIIEQGAAGTRALLARYDAVTARLARDDGDAGLLDELGALQEALDHADAWDLDSRLAQARDALRCPPPDTPVADLSGGERRRTGLCRLLLSQPDLLLLDEPTNHLDAESVTWLEQHLADYPGTVVAVTHDRYFLDHTAQWILEIDRGRAHVHEGDYTAYLEAKAARLRIEGRKDARRRARLADELAWARSGAKGRRALTKARVRRYEDLAAEAARPRTHEPGEISVPPGPRLGSLVLEAGHLTKSLGGRTLIEDLSFSLPRGGIVGVLGPNGVGKTTLFRMIAGEEHPDAGTLRLGDTVRISYVDQNRAGLDPAASVWEAVSGGEETPASGPETAARAYLATFGFKGADQHKPVGVLSGGERNRLHLALTLRQGGNLLLLDEPTNDLDVETLAALEHALLGFPGCVLVSAHDRWFLDRVATHILAWEGDAHWRWFEGNYTDYETDRRKRSGPDPARPHRAAHRRLVHG